ncbi:hypothetical protein L1987_62197 [Smallanthus sonchifolius]|uniref:Uncharacterized protein n=1 Tax=Smallanthus sonchifolius TaxID=185202 RepID=A0ACB9C9Q4_9ASTR|nr:hypothetical protein L1987_62197 [Smallanthus sonchifolius]
MRNQWRIIRYLYSLLLFLSLLLSDCAALDTIYADQSIKDGDTIVSNGKMFEMGFFSPGKSKNRYLGIWYKKISICTVVWVANRETPITDKSGMFKVSSDGNLVILSGGNTTVWSSNSLVSGRSNKPAVVVQLLDTGNIVVWERVKNSTNKKLIWQSFDYPGDTFLPGMKFGKDLVTGIEWSMTSWKSPDDPSIGAYSNALDTNGYPQCFGWQDQVLISRLGPWDGLGFSGVPIDKANPIYSSEFVVSEKEIYHKYELISSVIQRRVLTSDGRTRILHWIERIQDWIVYGDFKVDNCDLYAVCGPYGICSIDKHPPCTCMEGFEPRNPKEWDVSDWSSGCKRTTPLNCGDGFRKITGVKVPDTRKSWYNVSMTLVKCQLACRMNCACTAYANLDISDGGSGCLLWFEELIDIREYAEDHNVYIRMSGSEFADHQSDSNRRRKLVLSISSAALLLCVIAYACRKRNKNLQMQDQGDMEYALDKKNTSVQTQLLGDIPFISLYKVAKATTNFSECNKIGEGGFGPVYKGVLEDGQEVAVKRLSDTSQQGIDEFKNELISISKLQHRNLIKLLGYCIHRNETILIYEYMANKSLDSIIFDETRSSMLDWPQRFGIIHGIARGILYLHQDSRLQIIHRDLKAGNILLDGDMNPKISDFGLARKFEGHDCIAKTKKVVGTYGYISPEYAVHGRFSIKSDVFSFGVLVLEIVSGKKNREFSHEDHSDNLLGHAWRLHKQGRSTELMCASLHASCVIPEANIRSRKHAN